ncbi:MAG: L-aspartate oxidase [Clostridiales bacterium]|nr:L-aspartate oxidase [Clostridiales bacterium]
MKRYLVGVDKNTETIETDVLIIGSGIAGTYTALCISENIKVTILAKEAIDVSNTALAQGGIAVSLGDGDSPTYHHNDTLFAGAGLSDDDMVWLLVNEAKDNIKNLCDLGVKFDMSDGMLDLTKEAAHSKRRIIHAKDFTGKEVCDKLLASSKKRNNITLHENMFAIDIITENQTYKATIILDQKTGKKKIYKSKYVVCASGGFGQLYQITSNPIIATGDGMAMAYRAGATLQDMEFVQFHPTVLFHKKDKSFLISEAVRGEGAVLRNSFGEQFMSNYDELKELAPRDIVARAIFSEMGKTQSDCVYLDITFKSRKYLSERFPKIFNTCLKYGIDISKDYIPVAPAEHYCMGGIKTDLTGKTEIDRLYACGEVSCTGIHGANRLASNSLLEGLVFGKRIANDISMNHLRVHIDKKNYLISESGETYSQPVSEIEKRIKKTMNQNVGIVRDEKGLKTAKKIMDETLDILNLYKYNSMAQIQTANMAIIGEIVISSALARKESRGAHFRTDYPNTLDSFKKHITKKREESNDETF